MAQTKPLGKDKTANPRSRASKRATSPSIDLDKSLKDMPRAYNSNLNINGYKSNGIQKPRRQRRPKTRLQRLRQQKDQTRAENVEDQMSRKIASAQSRRSKTLARKAIWDDINVVNRQEPKQPLRANIPGRGEGTLDDQNWTDVQMRESDEELIDDAPLSGNLASSARKTESLSDVDRTTSFKGVHVEDETDQIT